MAAGLVSQTAVTIPESEGPLAGRHFFTQSHTWNGLVAGQGLQGVGDLERGSLNWSYDHVGNPTRLRYQGEMTGVKVIVDEATFTPFNEVHTRTLGASYERQAWHGFVYEEDTRRLERSTFDRDASVNAVADLRYDYDDAGNLLSVADVPDDLPGNHELQCFQYDELRRLAQAWAQGDTSECASQPGMGILGGPAPYWNSYEHDVVGNRTGETLREPGESAVTRAYEFPDAGDPQPHTLQEVSASGGEVWEFSYDQAGNTTSRDLDGQVQTLTWDAEGRIEQVTEPGEDPLRMVYDADGDRLLRDDGDQVTAFLPQTELTWDKTSDTVDGVRYFTHAGQVVATCSGQDVADWTFMGADHHGTTTTHAVNAFTAVEQVRRMDPYGNPRGAAPHDWPGQQGFVGGVNDPTGLVHVGARSYDPATGRFLSADPIMLLGDDQQINGYAYADNNPLTYSDPTGLCRSDGHNLCPYDEVHEVPVPPSRSRSQPNGGCDPSRYWFCRPPAQSTADRAPGDWPGVEVGGNAEFYPHGTTLYVGPSGQVVLDGVDITHLYEANPHMPAPNVLAAGLDEFRGDQPGRYSDDLGRPTLGVELRDAVSQGFIPEADHFGTKVVFLELDEPGVLAGPMPQDQYGHPGAPRRGCSFVPGTLVLMADLTRKPIEEVAVGDLVLATDPETGQTKPQPVTDTITGTGEKLLVQITVTSFPLSATVYTTTDTRQLGPTPKTTSVTATDNHPFWVASDDSWRNAADLRSGDQLRTLTGTSLSISKISTRSVSLTVYDLTIANLPVYYVLAGTKPIRGILHAPQGLDPLPRNPLGLAGACVAGATGAGTLIAGAKVLKHGWKSGAAGVRGAGPGGCLAGGAAYMGWWW